MGPSMCELFLIPTDFMHAFYHFNQDEIIPGSPEKKDQIHDGGKWSGQDHIYSLCAFFYALQHDRGRHRNDPPVNLTATKHQIYQREAPDDIAMEFWLLHRGSTSHILGKI